MNQNATLYFGGPILTMEGPNPQALLVQDGKIAALGTRKQLSALAPHAQHRDLEGRALLPAFLDSHSHITALASTLELCQLGAASSFAEIAAKLRKFSIQYQLPTDAWVIGFGYDHNVLLERTHPTRQILDQVFPDRPVLITHASGHMGVANTAALERLEITAHTSDPTGGRIGRESDGKTPNGYLEEAAFFRSSSVMPVPTAQQALSQLTAAQQIYLSHGITLVQDGLTGPGQDALLSTLAEQDGLITDVVGYADQKQSPHLATRPPIGQYRIGGYKIFLDGSPQGRTAWMLSPYLGNDPTYHGYPIYTDDQVTAFVKQALKEGRQLLAHCNGDAAAAQYIRCCRRAQCETGRPLSTIRPVMIHAQLVQQEQLVEMAELGMIPSFFAAHVWYWGDVHTENFGANRAASISPLHSAAALGLPFTLHQDSPVIAPNMLETVWCAVNRITRNGLLLGPQERISPLEALKAITLHAARQYFLEDTLGSLAPGKRADLVLLSADPTAVSPDQIRNIRVLETIRAGVCVYQSKIS